MPETLAVAALVGEHLLARGWKLATAESCTGGMVAAAVTDIAGSSAWFERGFVTYSNESKIELLGVPADVIATRGAVSEETARAMAEGALRKSHAQISVAITGIAGPGGAVPGKPVGTVCFAYSRQSKAGGFDTQSETMHFDGDRAAVRNCSVMHALEGLLGFDSAHPPA